MAGKSARPILITVISAIFAIAGILYLIGGVCILAGMDIDTAVEGEPIVVGAAYVISALIYLIVATGLLKGWKVCGTSASSSRYSVPSDTSTTPSPDRRS